jgi:hypothetical protein
MPSWMAGWLATWELSVDWLADWLDYKLDAQILIKIWQKKTTNQRDKMPGETFTLLFTRKILSL